MVNLLPDFKINCHPVLLRYLIALQKCLGLYSENGQYSADDVERLSALYKSLKEEYSWSSAVKVNHYNLYFIWIDIFLFFGVSMVENYHLRRPSGTQQKYPRCSIFYFLFILMRIILFYTQSQNLFYYPC